MSGNDRENQIESLFFSFSFQTIHVLLPSVTGSQW